MGEKGGLDEPAFVADACALGDEGGAACLVDLDIGGDLVEMTLMDQCADIGGGVQRVADL